MSWEVGQEVFVHYNARYHGGDYTAVITKVARKWVTIERAGLCLSAADRFDAETGDLDGKGYSSPGAVYPSEEVFRERTEAERLLGKIRRGHAALHPEVTLADVQQAARLLRIDTGTPS